MKRGLKLPAATLTPCVLLAATVAPMKRVSRPV
jgi:hypothetical protein